MSINKQNLYNQIASEFGRTLTMEGDEFEVEWYEAAIPVDSSVFLRVTMPPEKYFLLNYREVRATAERGFYRLYKIFSGGTVSRTLPIINLRNDSDILSGAIFEVVTTPTFNVADAFSAIPIWGSTATRWSVNEGGSLSKPESIRIFEPGVQVLAQFENNAAEECDFFSNFKFWTLTPGAIPPVEEV